MYKTRCEPRSAARPRGGACPYLIPSLLENQEGENLSFLCFGRGNQAVETCGLVCCRLHDLGVPAARRPSGGRRAARGRAAALRAGGLPAALRSAGPAAAVPPTRSAPPHSGMPDRAPTPDQKTTHRSATHTWSAAHTSEPCLGQEAIGCCTEALEATAATAATAAGASQPPAHGQPAQHALG